jgi:apoptosis-inducing factor 3
MEKFDQVPFFWTEQYDLALAYIGHGTGWDTIEIEGDLAARDCSLTYRKGGRKVAVAVIHRDRAGLLAELEFEATLARHRSTANGDAVKATADSGRRACERPR